MAEDVKSMANEETKATVDALSSSKIPSEVNAPIQPTAVTTPQPAKEVKPVAPEAKDPTGEFDYSTCKTYTVKEGQTLLDVANDVLVAYQQLRYFNHLNKSNPQVHAGQVISFSLQSITLCSQFLDLCV